MPQRRPAPRRRRHVRGQGDRAQPHRGGRRAGAAAALRAAIPAPRNGPDTPQDAAPPRLSVVVPTLNEAAYLGATLTSLAAGAEGLPRPEVVVSDSGSRDATVAVARRCGARVVEPPAPLPHRAAACNQGARTARGDVLLFLDADVALPAGWDREVTSALAAPDVVGGAFELTFDAETPGLRRIERVNRLRYRWSRHFYGDQALFVRRDAFRAVGGFPELPVLESAHLAKALQRRGRLVLVPRAVRASARRFLAGGVARVFLHDVLLWLGFALHLPPRRLGRGYWQANRRGDFAAASSPSHPGSKGGDAE